MPRRANTLEDFWARVDKSGEHWMWTGVIETRPNGSEAYGRFSLDGKNWMAHRLSWSLDRKREIPKGKIICHHCDIPLCVHPDDLYLGTHKTNARDREERGRGANGERHPHAHLTEADVIAIRAMADTATLREIGKCYGISLPNASRIIQGKSWRRADGEIRESLGVGRPAKLTTEQCDLLLVEYASGATQRQLAQRFGISQGSVSNYLRRCPSPA